MPRIYLVQSVFDTGPGTNHKWEDFGLTEWVEAVQIIRHAWLRSATSQKVVIFATVLLRALMEDADVRVILGKVVELAAHELLGPPIINKLMKEGLATELKIVLANSASVPIIVTRARTESKQYQESQ